MCIRKLIEIWRKNGSLPLLIVQIIAMLTSPLLLACVMPLWLTLPCGIKAVNDNWYLWYPRQLLFVTLSIAAIMDVIN